MEFVEGATCARGSPRAGPWAEVVERVRCRRGAGWRRRTRRAGAPRLQARQRARTGAATGSVRVVATSGWRARDEGDAPARAAAESASVSALDSADHPLRRDRSARRRTWPPSSTPAARSTRAPTSSASASPCSRQHGARSPATGSGDDRGAGPQGPQQPARAPPPRGSDVPGWLYRPAPRAGYNLTERPGTADGRAAADLQAGRARRQRRGAGPRRDALLAAAVAGGTAWAMTGPGVCERRGRRASARWWHVGRRAADRGGLRRHRPAVRGGGVGQRPRARSTNTRRTGRTCTKRHVLRRRCAASSRPADGLCAWPTLQHRPEGPGRAGRRCSSRPISSWRSGSRRRWRGAL